LWTSMKLSKIVSPIVGCSVAETMTSCSTSLVKSRETLECRHTALASCISSRRVPHRLEASVPDAAYSFRSAINDRSNRRRSGGRSRTSGRKSAKLDALSGCRLIIALRIVFSLQSWSVPPTCITKRTPGCGGAGNSSSQVVALAPVGRRRPFSVGSCNLRVAVDRPTLSD
jgi:hypothetical protein